MSIPHKVRPGDSLWFLSHQYLGSGGLWQKIEAHHNQEVAKASAGSRLRHIGDPNLIFVGETIMIPRLPWQNANAGNGRRLNANRMAQGMDLKVSYKIEGKDNQYRQELPNCIIEAKLSGNISIENLMQNRHEHNYELAMGRNSAEIKHSMSQFHEQAFKDLTQSVSLDFISGAVKLQAPIMYKAGIGPYTVEVQAENPLTYKGTFKPAPISA